MWGENLHPLFSFSDVILSLFDVTLSLKTGSVDS